MNWIEINVKTTNEAVEAVSSIFDGLGAMGVKIENALDYKNYKASYPSELFSLEDIPHLEEGAIVSAYFDENDQINALVKNLRMKINELKDFSIDIGDASITTVKVKNEDWNTTWKKYYHPVRISRYLTIKPSWSDYEPQMPDEKVICLDPGEAFGTGTHPTTRLCLQALEVTLRGGEQVYDVGTGSGVLSIAASYLGAKNILATDVDDIAVNAAQKNLSLNQNVENITLKANDLLNGINEPVDVIVANILPDVLEPLIPQASKLIKKDSYIILSGIIDDKLDLILNTLKENNLKIQEVLTLNQWRAVIATNKQDD